MPISTLSANMVVQWALTHTNTGGFAPTTQGPDGVEYNLADLNTIFDQLYSASLTVNPSSTTTLDLTSLTNLVDESLSFTALLFLFALPSGAALSVGPGASNGLQIFGGTGVAVGVPVNGALFWGGDPAGAGLTVNSTNKTLAFRNAGAGTLTLDLVLAGDA
ncbi:hypothetical protein [Frigoriglobus tundricola]|uniref:Uncharacterized protein n=1 Tax=Frigoriglobus tundricola TaxID=2774151 RepID=A0A6M5YXG1_9BACT|nr:hypothetical protein [Frigoriglobus tundricola]QJW98689.1 hypothetical protein FTUN_6284 [Frigoriglobus tundricola]